MIVFDKILPILKEVFLHHEGVINSLGNVIVNRDLSGRIRLILDDSLRNNDEAQENISKIVAELSNKLSPHSYPVDNMVIYEPFPVKVIEGSSHCKIEGLRNAILADRLASESNWGEIVKESAGAPRIVFFSIKGGVGRSTALAASAWSLAQSGKRVMVLDLDLESPGLSSSLLPDDRRPQFGITDWLVEDLVENGNTILEGMVATSDLSHDGEIYVVPAHGREPGEYISKLGRIWMPKVIAEGRRESWAKRLHRLISDLESRYKPDVILIDSRAGIDEVASACITDLGADSVLLFTIDGDQTWTGFSILFRHWLETGVVRDIRERLQIVGAMIPEENRVEYMAALRQNAWTACSEYLYDDIPAGDGADSECFNFDVVDDVSPHSPWTIRWNRGFASLKSLHARLVRVDADEVKNIFGPLLDGISGVIESKGFRNE